MPLAHRVGLEVALLQPPIERLVLHRELLHTRPRLSRLRELLPVLVERLTLLLGRLAPGEVRLFCRQHGTAAVFYDALTLRAGAAAPAGAGGRPR